MGGFAQLLALAISLAWLFVSTAGAECTRPPEPTLGAVQEVDYAQGISSSDRIGRVVAPITVNGFGPFRFIVDTGANRSVLSQQLAERLGLTSGSVGEVHSVLEVATAPFVDAQALRYRDLPLSAAPMPVLQGNFLAGEEGVLGADSLRGRRLRIDFVHNCIEIAQARNAPRHRRDWAVVRGRLRFGHLVVVPGRIDDVDVTLFLDTGSNQTLGNSALQRALVNSVRRVQTIEERVVAYTAGHPVLLDNAILVPRMRIGARNEVMLRNVTAYVGPFHIFELWGLQDQPSMLIGMDVLSQVRELAIDYERALVEFRFSPSAMPSISMLQNVTRIDSPTR